MNRWAITLGMLLASLLPAASAEADPAFEWRSYAHDAGGTRFSPLSQITPDNAAQLERAWTYRTGDIAEGSAHYAECTPLMVDGVLYMITPFSRLIAIDATTGAELWRFTPDPPLNVKETGGGGLASRGVTWWQSGEQQRIFLPVRDGRIYSINLRTHQPDPDFGGGGAINLREGLPEGGRFLFLSSPPAVCGDILLPPYGIDDNSARLLEYVPLRAYDARTGALRWTFNTVAQPGQFGHETWAGDSWSHRAGCNPWAPIAVDEARGIFYASIGAPNSDKWGGDRPGDNLFSNALVAVKAATGERLWHFQAVHHDLWDYDMPAQPNLFEWHSGDQVVPAVAVVGKTGFVYAFERVTGAPLFPIEERPVPASTFPGEQAAPTQPFPTKPPAFVRQRMTTEDLSAIDPASHEALLKIFQGLRSEGLFTPPSQQGTVVLPGQHGGGNWSGTAVSPSGMMYITTTELPYLSALRPSDGAYGVSPEARQWRDAKGYPAVEPPWGTLTKIDLNRGELLWQHPLGEFPEVTAKGVPPTGTPNFGGATITAGGVGFVAAAMDAKLRAFDMDSGTILCELPLDAAGYGAPVTYLGRDGGQYVAVFAGGGGKYGSKPGDYVIGFRVP